MGVPGLWTELASVGSNTTLAAYAWTAWPRGEDAPGTLLRVGVDATQWVYQAQKARGGVNPVLRTLFFRLARLLALPVHPVFVFDGPHRPPVKRGAAVYTGPHAITAPFCAFIEHFGFTHWTAPAEAEAELAWMNRARLVDVVLTDDVDALAFGALVVLRPRGRGGAPADEGDQGGASDATPALPPLRASSPLRASRPPGPAPVPLPPVDDSLPVTLFDTRTTALPLTPDGMVLVAMLSGGDYCVHGVVHCGIKTAAALARAGHGATLIDAFRRTHTPSAVLTVDDAWACAMARWRARLGTELAENTSGALGTRMPRLAASLPGTLWTQDADRRCLHNYIHPRTSSRDAALEALCRQQI
ncbi:hypothetical protein MSPP1_003534 [Malassezia sp. CBS 17886]|nr:hypothetical protein MSPP1_003534 [Malassezia sp. CBS 17886]